MYDPLTHAASNWYGFFKLNPRNYFFVCVSEHLGGQFEKWEHPYSQLKSQLTPHQHAILIDLGRTFPNHG